MMLMDDKKLESIENLVRIERCSPPAAKQMMEAATFQSYDHKDIYGDFCQVQAYVDCPPEKIFEYMANVYMMEEWTYGIRSLKTTDQEGLYKGSDALVKDTAIYIKVHAIPKALVVDYHCAWDQRDELWMIYLYRIVPAQLVLGRRGSVIFWQNCRHPYYTDNPYPNKSPEGRIWVGQLWNLFPAGHAIELNNLKSILEYRYRNNFLEIGSDLNQETSATRSIIKAASIEMCHESAS
ncbi:MAG: SRPBCC family protein [Oligoflexales bacterium]|nr:SRPBCC family protein [Oligoflexales bacterium]